MRRSEGRVRDEGKDSADKSTSGLVSASFFLLGKLYNREAGLADFATISRGAVRLRAKCSLHRLLRTAQKRLEVEAKRAPSRLKISQDLLAILNLDHRRLEAQTTNSPIKERATSRWVKIRAPRSSLTLNSTTSLAPILKVPRQDQNIFWSAGTNSGRS